MNFSMHLQSLCVMMILYRIPTNSFKGLKTVWFPGLLFCRMDDIGTNLFGPIFTSEPKNGMISAEHLARSCIELWNPIDRLYRRIISA